MINSPQTREEAKKFKYGAGPRYSRLNFRPEQCAYSVDAKLWHQCSRKPGYGPAGLYCKQHANQFVADGGKMKRRSGRDTCCSECKSKGHCKRGFCTSDPINCESIMMDVDGCTMGKCIVCRMWKKR